MFRPIKTKFRHNGTIFSPICFQLHNHKKYKLYYEILGIPEDSCQEEVRKAYLNLVKKYHPDSGSLNADVNKFQQVEEAFRILTERKLQQQQVNEMKMEEHDIEHTAPQHRQYLSYDGIGIGNPFQRQKQYTQVKAMKAAENVLQHRISKTIADEKSLMVKVPFKHKIKTQYGFERLVEDLIQEGMSKGIFDNLAGRGKPLSRNIDRNPHVDFITYKLNEVLIENGFCPEWITLQKEIRQNLKELRCSLSLHRSYLGASPLNESEKQKWDAILKKYESAVSTINKQISKYNLVVPVLNKQMLLVSLEKEASKILRDGEHSLKSEDIVTKKSEFDAEVDRGPSLLSIFDVMFRKLT